MFKNKCPLFNTPKGILRYNKYDKTKSFASAVPNRTSAGNSGRFKYAHKRVSMNEDCHVSWMFQKLITSPLGVVSDGGSYNAKYVSVLYNISCFGMCLSKFPPMCQLFTTNNKVPSI